VTFKIPGSEIGDFTGDVSVGITAADMYTITFKSGDTTLGKVKSSADDKEGQTSFKKAFFVNDTITANDIPGFILAAGYQVVWVENPTNQIVTADKTYVAGFEKATYDVNWGSSAATDTSAQKATYDRDLTFTPTGNGVIVTGVTYTVAGTYDEDNSKELKKQTATKNADGSYTIAGSTITGNITINVETTSAKFTFISYREYQGLVGGTKIAVLTLTNVSDLDTDHKWYLDYGTTQTVFLWSSSYGAYLAIVDKNETEATLSAKLVCGSYSDNDSDNSYKAFKLLNKGDVDRDGDVDIFDITMIDNVLMSTDKRQSWSSISDINRLEMDVSGVTDNAADGTPDKTVSVVDINWILDETNGLHS
jgi:hypothetical protein